MSDDTCIAEVVECIWKTLDYHNIEDEIDEGGAAVHGRFSFLQNELKSLFSAKMITRANVRLILDYCHRTLFSHLHLYLSCLSAKQPRKAKPVVIMNSIPQFALAGGLESAHCKQVNDSEGEGEEEGQHIVEADMEGMEGEMGEGEEAEMSD